MTLWDYLVAAVAFGTSDSMNPYMLSMILCSLVFGAFIGNTQCDIVRTGRWVLGTVFLGTFSLAWARNVLEKVRPEPNIFLGIFSLGVAVLLLTAGYLLFQQWRLGKVRVTAQQWLPAFLRDPLEGGREKTFHITAFSVIIGGVTIVLTSLWPKDPSAQIVYYFLFNSGNVLLATLFFALYSVSFISLLSVAWVAVFFLKGNAKLRGDFLKIISWARIISSAVFIAVGMGLIYLFIAM